MTDTNRAAGPVGWSLLETYPRVSSGPLAELRPEDVVDVYPDTADVALVDLDLMQMRCGMGAASRRAPVVLPEVGAQAVLQRPLDCFRVAVDAGPLVANDRLPATQAGRDLLLVLLVGRVVVDRGVDGTLAGPPAAICSCHPRLACVTPAPWPPSQSAEASFPYW